MQTGQTRHPQQTVVPSLITAAGGWKTQIPLTRLGAPPGYILKCYSGKRRASQLMY